MNIIDGERHRRDCFTAVEVEHAHRAVTAVSCMFPRESHSQKTAAGVRNKGRSLLPCAAADLACSDMLGLSHARNVKD